MGQEKMRIVVLTINYTPEIVGAAHLIHDLAVSLKNRGHELQVLTGYPRYNLLGVPPRYRRGLRMKEIFEGIEVQRIRFPQRPRASKIGRGFQHFIFAFWLGLLFVISPRADVALVFSPPLPLPLIICLLGRILAQPVVVNIQDLFPREAIQLGMMNNRFLIQIFESMERKVHQLAAGITVHSPGNKEHVLQHGGQQDRVHVIYNWVDTERFLPGDRNNEFARQHGLMEKFIVSYAGTMGWAQDMGTIIKSAHILQGHPRIQFLLVGDGVEKGKAQTRSRELGLRNILWLPIQPYQAYPDILAASDISLINLHPELRTPVVPSKLLSIMSAARPVVASLPLESDARRIIAEAGCGISVKAGDGEGLAAAILSLASDRVLARDMGSRGRAYVEGHFSRKRCTVQVEDLLKNVIRESQ